jgi:hypothetical protein
MEEVFQNFNHYKEWILKNWNTSKTLDSNIVESRLMIEKEISCNGEPFRMLTAEEFNVRHNENYIKVPTV